MIKRLTAIILSLFLSSFTFANTILIVGDSISAGYGIPNGKGWVTLLEKTLEEKGRYSTIVNASISGDTTTNGLSRLPPLLEEHHPDIVIIELGGNDGLRATSPKLIEKNLLEMVEKSKASGAKVLLVGIHLPPNYGRQYIKQFLAVYPAVAKKTGAILLSSIVENIGDNDSLMQGDGVHPNEKAQPMIRDMVFEKVLPLL